MPFADIGPLKVPDSLTDEQVLFLSDIFPTGYMAADNCQITPGDTVAVWGCGPVGQFAIKSAYLLGAERVIAIDRFAERLELASSQGGAETLNYEDVDVLDALRHMTGGQGPDACIDAVGLEAHGTTLDALVRPRENFDVSWRPIGRMRFGRRSAPAARAAPFRFPASTADGWTSFRWALRSPRA